jgi:cholesterol oxidase
MPTYIEKSNEAAQWLAKRTGGIAQSSVLEAVANIPSIAHMLGGAVIGVNAESGVVDMNLHAFGYQNMPTNPGVNPALTITALAEYAMAQIPASAGGSR